MTIDWKQNRKRLEEKLSRRYDFIERLALGGYGEIYKVKGKNNGKLYALKILNENILEKSIDKQKREIIKERFILEAKVLKKFQNSNIVKVHEAGVEYEIPYIVMEYIEGKTLERYLIEKGRLPFAEVLEKIKIILNAIILIHSQDLVHRDLKTNNIMIECGSGRVVIIDFGLAKNLLSRSKLTVTGTSIGTPFYMAPEQFIDSSKASPRNDIYAVGIILFEMVIGQVPFNGSKYFDVRDGHLNRTVPDPRNFRQDLPVGFEEILFKALEKKPDDRYQNSGEFLFAINGLTFDGIDTKSEELGTEAGESHNIKNDLIRKFLVYAFIFIIALTAFIIFNPLGIWKGVKDADFDDGIKMVYIPPGEFISSSRGKSNLPGYWIGKYEVSIKQYMEFVNSTQSNQPEWIRKKSGYEGFVEDDSLPIVGISYENARLYCRWLSDKTGRTFRLPTREEWIKAARGTEDDRIYPWGNNPPTCDLANYKGCNGKTMKVTSHSKGASPYGLYNMAGNVAEWCDDEYPRGGSFRGNKEIIKIIPPKKSRYSYKASDRLDSVGFRLCMEDPKK